MAAGEDTVLEVVGVLMIMFGALLEDSGRWGVIIGLLLLVLGLAWPYLPPLTFWT